MKLINKIKRILELAKKDPEALKVLEGLSAEQLQNVPEAKEEGDGKAVFIGEGTREEYEEFLKEESGEKSWLDRLKNL